MQLWHFGCAQGASAAFRLGAAVAPCLLHVCHGAECKPVAALLPPAGLQEALLQLLLSRGLEDDDDPEVCWAGLFF